MHGCAALPAHTPASSCLLPLQIPILHCCERSQLGKAALPCFSWTVFTNSHCLSQRWPGCCFGYQGLQALLADSLFVPTKDASQEAAEMLERAGFSRHECVLCYLFGLPLSCSSRAEVDVSLQKEQSYPGTNDASSNCYFLYQSDILLKGSQSAFPNTF